MPTSDYSFYHLTQAITADVLVDDEEYEEILEDMREECGKFGKNAL